MTISDRMLYAVMLSVFFIWYWKTKSEYIYFDASDLKAIRLV